MTATGGASGNPVTFTIDGASTGRVLLHRRERAVSFTGRGQLRHRRQPGRQRRLRRRTPGPADHAVGQGPPDHLVHPPAPAAGGGGAPTPAATAAPGNAGHLHRRPTPRRCARSPAGHGDLPDGGHLRHRRQPGRRTPTTTAATQVQQTIAVGRAPRPSPSPHGPDRCHGGRRHLRPGGHGGASGNPVTFTVDATRLRRCARSPAAR